MDEFDVIDFVYDAVESTGTGIMIYKDKSDAEEVNEHVVINHLPLNEFEFYNHIIVNVNIFVPFLEGGMTNRPRMKTLKRKIRKSLDNIRPVNGQYRDAEVIWSERVDLKEKFDCINI